MDLLRFLDLFRLGILCLLFFLAAIIAIIYLHGKFNNKFACIVQFQKTLWYAEIFAHYTMEKSLTIGGGTNIYAKRKKELNKLVRLASRNSDLDADKRFASFLDKLDDLASLTNAPIYGKTAAMASKSSAPQTPVATWH